MERDSALLRSAQDRLTLLRECVYIDRMATTFVFMILFVCLTSLLILRMSAGSPLRLALRLLRRAR